MLLVVVATSTGLAGRAPRGKGAAGGRGGGARDERREPVPRVGAGYSRERVHAWGRRARGWGARVEVARVVGRARGRPNLP